MSLKPAVAVQSAAECEAHARRVARPPTLPRRRGRHDWRRRWQLLVRKRVGSDPATVDHVPHMSTSTNPCMRTSCDIAETTRSSGLRRCCAPGRNNMDNPPGADILVLPNTTCKRVGWYLRYVAVAVYPSNLRGRVGANQQKTLAPPPQTLTMLPLTTACNIAVSPFRSCKSANLQRRRIESTQHRVSTAHLLGTRLQS